jgi:hypothetical protein
MDKDGGGILEIYDHYVVHSNITEDQEPLAEKAMLAVINVAREDKDPFFVESWRWIHEYIRRDIKGNDCEGFAEIGGFWERQVRQSIGVACKYLDNTWRK